MAGSSYAELASKSELAPQPAPVEDTNGRISGAASGRFILIDHSIVGEGGHYLEYARHVLAAASDQGYEVVLATNKAFRPARDAPWKVYALYPFDIWGRRPDQRPGWQWPGRLVVLARRALLRARISLLYSTYGLLWVAAHDPAEFVRRRSVDPADLLRWGVLLLPIVYFFALLSAVYRSGSAVVRPLWASYIGTLIWAVLRLAYGVLLPVAIVWRGRRTLLEAVSRGQRINGFAKATSRLISRIDMDSRDVVFIPTLSEIDLIGLARALRRQPVALQASWHLLFRRNIYGGRDPDYPSQDDSLAPLRRALGYTLDRLPGHRISLYTDTAPLTAQYDRLNVAPFRTLPIPVNPAYRQQANRIRPGPLKIVYVGDARSEKGYPLLPELVGALYEKYVATGRVQFVFQSNFGFASPKDDARTFVARSQLQGHAPREVRLITKALGSEDYLDLVRDSDIVLIPYDPLPYYARSSGVLVEALTAGIPVVVPGGSWMADQLQVESTRYHQRLAATMPVSRSLAAPDLRWASNSGVDSTPFRHGALAFGGSQARSFTWIDVEPAETHLLLRFKFVDGTPPRTHARVHFEQVNDAGLSIGKRVTLLSSQGNGFCTTLLVLSPTCQRVWVGVHNPFYDDTAEITNIELDLLSSGDRSLQQPLEAVGRVYAQPAEFPEAVREVVECYAHYRESAGAFATHWVETHSPQRLVSELGEAAATTVANRLSARSRTISR